MTKSNTIYSETSLEGDREEYITKENDGNKNYIYIDIYENLKSPYINLLMS